MKPRARTVVALMGDDDKPYGATEPMYGVAVDDSGRGHSHDDDGHHVFPMTAGELRELRAQITAVLAT